MKGQMMKDKLPLPTPQTNIESAGSRPLNGIPVSPPGLAESQKPREEPPGHPQSKPGRWGINLALLLAAASSGLVLSSCYFPLSWGWLAWVALVPLLALVRTKTHPVWVYLCAWVAGSFFYWTAISWMPYANNFMRLAWYALSFYCSLYTVAAVFLIRLLDRRTRMPLMLSVPVVWVGLEYVRAFLLTGFPWYYLSHTQHIFLPIIQVSDLGGAYTVSFLVAMVNGLVFEWLVLHQRFRSLFGLREPELWVRYSLPTWLRWQSAVAGLLLLAALNYGFWRLSQTEFEQGPQVALLQGNIDQNLRNQFDEEKKTTQEKNQAVARANKVIGEEYAALCTFAAEEYPGGVDLIIWPETSFPGHWFETRKEIPPFEVPVAWIQSHEGIRDKLRQMAALTRTNHLVGLNTVELVDPKKPTWSEKVLEFNSALLVYANGTTGGRYDKIHRIPFGEYVPLKDEWPWIKQFTPYGDGGYHIQAGKNLKRFQLGKYTFGVLICYEDTDPFLARQYGVEQEDGPPVSFLVNMSNDGWYEGTSEHNEHLAISRFRAVETRKALARAVNMGISAVIDGNGQVLQPHLIQGASIEHHWDVVEPVGQGKNMPVWQWNHFKKCSGVLTAVVPIDYRTSLYCLWGDWFACTCGALVLGGLVLAVLPGKKLRPIM